MPRPTVALVHKGEPAFDSFGDLLALNEILPVFGEFTNLSRYFTDATSGDYIGAQPADEFFCDYLDDRVTNQKRPEAVSGFPRQLRLRRRLDSAFTLAALHRAVTPSPGIEDEKALGELEGIERELELRGANTPDRSDELAEHLVPLETIFANRLAERLQTRSAEGQPGLLVFNPCGFTRRVALELPGFGGPIPVADSVKAAEFTGDLARLVVEVPPLGYAWIPRTAPVGTTQPKARVKLADGLTVRNEFIECDIDSQTGGIRSFRDLRHASDPLRPATRLQSRQSNGRSRHRRDQQRRSARRDRQHGRSHQRARRDARHLPPALPGLARAGRCWNCASNWK